MRVIDFQMQGPEAGAYAKFLESRCEGAFQRPEWALAKQREGWRPWGLLSLEHGEVRGGLIALERRLPAGLGLVGSLWHVPRGPVAPLDQPEGRDAAASLLSGLEVRVRARRGVAIRISPDARREADLGPWLGALGYAPAGGNPWLHTTTFRVDLTAPESEILARMNELKRRHIRKAASRGVWVDSSNDAGCFSEFHEMHRVTGDRNGFRVVPERRMKMLWEESGKRGWGRVFLSRAPDGEPLSGMLAIAPGSRCHYLFGASLPRCRELHPNELLHWEVMRWARGRGSAIYDLEGVAGRVSKEHPLYGNYLFKSGFGGDYVELAGEYERILRPRTYRVLHWAISRFRGGKGQASAPEGERHA